MLQLTVICFLFTPFLGYLVFRSVVKRKRNWKKYYLTFITLLLSTFPLIFTKYQYSNVFVNRLLLLFLAINGFLLIWIILRNTNIVRPKHILLINILIVLITITLMNFSLLCYEKHISDQVINNYMLSIWEEDCNIMFDYPPRLSYNLKQLYFGGILQRRIDVKYIWGYGIVGTLSFDDEGKRAIRVIPSESIIEINNIENAP